MSSGLKCSSQADRQMEKGAGRERGDFFIGIDRPTERASGCPSERDVNASASRIARSLYGRLRSVRAGNPIDEWVFQRGGSVRSVGSPFGGRKGTIGPIRIACQIIWSAVRLDLGPAGRPRRGLCRWRPRQTSSGGKLPFGFTALPPSHALPLPH